MNKISAQLLDQWYIKMAIHMHNKTGCYNSLMNKNKNKNVSFHFLFTLFKLRHLSAIFCWMPVLPPQLFCKSSSDHLNCLLSCPRKCIEKDMINFIA